MRLFTHAMLILIVCTSALARPDEPLPSADDVMNRFIEVTGGKEAYEKVKSRVIVGSVAVPSRGVTGKLAIYIKSPNMVLESVDIPGAGSAVRCYNGNENVGWQSSDLDGVRLIQGEELEQLRSEADPHSDISWRDRYQDAKVVGVEKIGGRDQYKIELTHKTGRPEIRFYDKETGLLQRVEMEFELASGLVSLVSVPSDYRDVEGVKTPFKTTQQAQVGGMPIEQIMTLEKIETNVEIADDKFQVPRGVKKLVEKSKAATKSATTTKSN